MRRGEAPREDSEGGKKRKTSKKKKNPPKTLSLHHLLLMWKSTNKHAGGSGACAPTSVKAWGEEGEGGAEVASTNAADRKQAVLPSEAQTGGLKGGDGR